MAKKKTTKKVKKIEKEIISFKCDPKLVNAILERCVALGFLRNDKPMKSEYIRFAIQQEMQLLDAEGVYKSTMQELNQCKNEVIHLQQQLARWQWIAEKERQKKTG